MNKSRLLVNRTPRGVKGSFKFFSWGQGKETTKEEKFFIKMHLCTYRSFSDISDRESEKFPRLAEGIEKKLIAFASLCGTARRSYYIAGNGSNDRGR